MQTRNEKLKKGNDLLDSLLCYITSIDSFIEPNIEIYKERKSLIEGAKRNIEDLEIILNEE